MAKGKYAILATIGVEAKRLAKDLKTATGKLTSWAKSTVKAVMSIAFKGTAAAAAAIAAFGAMSLKEFASFEQGMSEVFTLLPGISEKAMAQMSDQALQLSQKMGVLPEDVVPALYSALSAGVPPDNVFNFLEAAVKASKAGVVDLNTAVDALTTVVNTYGKENITAARAADIMFEAVKMGKTTFGEMASTMYNVLPIANAANVSFEDLASAVATMTSKGTPTAQVMTQLKAAIQSIIAPSTRSQKKFQELGLDARELAKVVAGPGGLVKAMNMIVDAANGDMITLRKLLGSVEAISAVLTLTGDKGMQFNSVLQGMSTTTGQATTAFEMMDKGIARSWERISASMKVAMIKAGKAIAPFAEAAVPTIMRIIEMIESIPWTKMMQGFANVWLVGIRPHLQNLAAALLSLPWGNLLMTLRPVAELVIKAIQNIIKIAIALTPAIVPGISALGALFVFLYGKFFLLISFISKLAPSLGLIFKDVFEIMRTAFLFFMNPTQANFQAFIAFTKKKLKDLWRHIKFLGEDIVDAGWEMWLKFKFAMLAVFGDMFDEAKKKFMEFLQNIPGWTAFATLWREAWLITKEELLKAWEELKKAMTQVGEVFATGNADSQKMKDSYRGLIQDIFAMVGAIILLVVQLVKLAGMFAAVLAKHGELTNESGAAKKQTNFLTDAIAFMIDMIRVLIQVANGIIVALGFVVGIFADLKDEILLSIDVFMEFKEAITKMLGEFWQAVKNTMSNVTKAFSDAWNQIKTDVGKVFVAFKDWLKAMGDWVYELLWGGTITKDFKSAFEFIEKVVMKVLNAIKDIFKTVFDGIKSGVDGLKTAFQSFGDFVNGIFEKVLKFGERAMDLAKGVLKGAGKVFGDLFGGGKSAGGGGRQSRSGSGGGRQPRSGSGGGITPGSLTTSLKPIFEKLTSMDGSLKSIDKTLKGKFVNQ